MSISELFTPVNARYTIPALVLIMYALYRLVRYRLLHPKAAEDDSLTAGELSPKTSEASIKAPISASVVASAPVATPGPVNTAKPEATAGPAPEPARRSQHSRLSDKLHGLLKDATEGDPMSFARIGEFALSRGAIVEAHFWFSLAKIKGVKGVDKVINSLRKRWILMGRPIEAENLYDIFGRTRNQVAFAYIAYCTGFSASINKKILDDLSGVDDPCTSIIIQSLKQVNGDLA